MVGKKTKKTRKKRVRKKVNKQAIHEARVFLERYKQGIVCCVCGENHPACLEHHHKDPSKKEFNIGSSVWKGKTRAQIQREIRKCIVLCSNCHKKEHFKD